MVKTRAQREQGVVTPSPKSTEQVKSRKGKGTNQRRNVVTQKSRSGTEEKSTRARQDTMTIATPRSTRNTKTPRYKSPDTNTLSEERRQKTSARLKQAGGNENENEEEGVEGCHSDLLPDDANDAIQEKTAMMRKSSRKARRGRKVKAQEVEGTKLREDDDEAIDPEENGGQEEERMKEAEEHEGEEEEEEDSENENNNLDADDAGLQLKPQTEEGCIPEGPDGESDDDDDAPQDVSFSASRQEALDSISQALQQTKRTEERAKEKRRNRDKLLKLQKERKKISLEHSRLPQDFLSEVARIQDEQLPEPTAAAAPTNQRTEQERHHKVFDSDGEMDFDEGDDYIPVSSDAHKVVEGFEVHAISRQRRAPPPKSDMALNFLQQQLYGAKIKRESVIKHKARLLKRQGKPSLAFHNPKEKRRKHKHKGHIRPTAASQ